MGTIWSRPVLRETLLLAAICWLDAVYTLLAVRMGWAHETNPLLIPALRHSDAAFMTIKGVSFLLPLAMLEGLRNRHPELIQRAVRLALLGYIAIYVFGSIGLLLK